MGHKDEGIEYLISLGYNREDIADNAIQGEPDLVTKDGKYWEIKRLEGLTRITFTYDQLLKFNGDVNIIIFGGSMDKGKFIECIKYGDIIKKMCHKDDTIKFVRDYKIFVNINVDIASAYEMEKEKIGSKKLAGHRYHFDFINYHREKWETA